MAIKKSAAKPVGKSAVNSAPKSAKRAGLPAAGAVTAMGLSLKPWTTVLRRARGAEARSGSRCFLFAFAHRDVKVLKKTFTGHLNAWQLKSMLESEAESLTFQGSQGPIWILLGPSREKLKLTSSGLEKSGVARFRDLAGTSLAGVLSAERDKLVIELHGLSKTEQAAVITGLEIANYSFREAVSDPGKKRRLRPQLLAKEIDLNEDEIQAAGKLGFAVNLARHYTNLPAGALNPKTYAESVEQIFAGSKSVKVEVWEGERLTAERMGLLQAVGGAASEGPRLVHVKYRPQSSSGRAPVAIVGKGVTFDSGGLDLKPSSGMRFMKKDMGGSAAAVALAKWAELTQLKLPLDIYMSLAENAVGRNSFRPGDVLVARSGTRVEISNTDAEGRLVLADALDVAINQKGSDLPSAVIDIATLTGAIKVGLGADIAGLFCNDEHLATVLCDSGLATGDLMWRMPLYQPYRTQLKSHFAEMVNSSEISFGGAITAALFLESFVGQIPWAHLDIYAWKDLPAGAWTESGGSGQSVLALSRALSHMAEEK